MDGWCGVRGRRFTVCWFPAVDRLLLAVLKIRLVVLLLLLLHQVVLAVAAGNLTVVSLSTSEYQKSAA